MLGFDAAFSATRPRGRPFFLQAVENFLHAASLSIMRDSIARTTAPDPPPRDLFPSGSAGHNYRDLPP
jgi:hypothetical protein